MRDRYFFFGSTRQQGVRSRPSSVETDEKEEVKEQLGRGEEREGGARDKVGFWPGLVFLSNCTAGSAQQALFC